MPFKAVIFDAYGTLVRNEGHMLIPRRIVADHALTADVEDVVRVWIDCYADATQRAPFRTLRAIHAEIMPQVLQHFGVQADATPYVDLFFRVTTSVELYPEVPEVLAALGSVRAAVVSNADHEHLAAWTFALPVEFILVSEAMRVYKPDPRVFHWALDRLGLHPDDVLHVGDSELDDIQGAKAAGLRVAWVNRDGRPRRAGVPAPDFELRDLKGLLAVL